MNGYARGYAANGMNLARSINNPNSRLNRIRNYLAANGPATKREILRDVFGKRVSVFGSGRWINGVWHDIGAVTIGWGTYVFGLGAAKGYLHKERRGNTIYWYVDVPRRNYADLR
jgi:hypothetical protein